MWADICVFALLALIFLFFMIFVVEFTIWTVICYGVLVLIILFVRHDIRKLYRCDRSGKSGLRATRPVEIGEYKWKVTREYTCKYCGYTAWMPDADIPPGTF